MHAALACVWSHFTVLSVRTASCNAGGVPSGMQLLSGMYGNHCTLLPHVPVAPTSMLSMFSLVQRVDYLLFDITRSGTSLQSCVCIEPHLQLITGETLTEASAITGDEARLDVAASDFWGGCYERSHFDVRVFNPPTNRQTLPTCYRKHENIKKRAYEQRICEVEHGSFTSQTRATANRSGLQRSQTFQGLVNRYGGVHAGAYGLGGVL